MRFFMFLAVSFAMAAAVGSGVDLQAKCRCNKSARGERRANKCERRAAKRGAPAQCAPQPNGGGSGYNPYGGDAVNQIGAAAPGPAVELPYRVTAREDLGNGWTLEQHCYGTYCKWVRVPPKAPPAPEPDPEFKAVPPPQVIPPEVEPQASLFPPGVISGS